MCDGGFGYVWLSHTQVNACSFGQGIFFVLSAAFLIDQIQKSNRHTIVQLREYDSKIKHELGQPTAYRPVSKRKGTLHINSNSLQFLRTSVA